MDRRSLLLALAGAPFASAAFAQNAGPPALSGMPGGPGMPGGAGPGAGPAGPLSPQQYRMMALMGGEFAMQTSRMALERSRNPRVREFAQLEINEQTAVAASLGAAPGTASLRQDQAAMMQQLSSMSGAGFDRMYVRGQLMGHEELLALNTGYQQANFGDTLGLAVANVAVPSIQTHLAILSRLRA